MASAPLAGCAPAFVALTGGRTVPSGRSDLAAGGAVRVPVGELAVQPGSADSDLALGAAAPGGAAPVGFFRHGLGDDVDLGLSISSTHLGGSLRGRVRVGPNLSLVGGLAPMGGLAREDGSVFRVGGTVPLALAIDALSLIEVWIGLRVGIDHVGGQLGQDAAARRLSLIGVRTGGMLGLAVGFRRLAVLVELAVDHEYWIGSLADASIERSGVALTPAFAVRVRL